MSVSQFSIRNLPEHTTPLQKIGVVFAKPEIPEELKNFKFDEIVTIACEKLAQIPPHWVLYEFQTASPQYRNMCLIDETDTPRAIVWLDSDLEHNITKVELTSDYKTTLLKNLYQKEIEQARQLDNLIRTYNTVLGFTPGLGKIFESELNHLWQEVEEHVTKYPALKNLTGTRVTFTRGKLYENKDTEECKGLSPANLSISAEEKKRPNWLNDEKKLLHYIQEQNLEEHYSKMLSRTISQEEIFNIFNQYVSCERLSMHLPWRGKCGKKIEALGIEWLQSPKTLTDRGLAVGLLPEKWSFYSFSSDFSDTPGPHTFVNNADVIVDAENNPKAILWSFIGSNHARVTFPKNLALSILSSTEITYFKNNHQALFQKTRQLRNLLNEFFNFIDYKANAATQRELDQAWRPVEAFLEENPHMRKHLPEDINYISKALDNNRHLPHIAVAVLTNYLGRGTKGIKLIEEMEFILNRIKYKI